MPPQPHDAPLIQATDLYKSFGDHAVINGVNLNVYPGEVVAVIGISGCGKSTLLRLISGLETPDQGDVTLSNSNCSFVFQYSALFDSMTVFENVAFSLTEPPDDEDSHFIQRTPDQIREIVMEKLDMVGLDDFAHYYPSQLSGGMKKRVSFARAIVNNPHIILYDEPTAGLDPIASTMLEDYILKLRDEMGAASVVVTHQHSTIHRTADKICMLHEGKIVWVGTPAELDTSSDPFAQQFATASLNGPLMATH